MATLNCEVENTENIKPFWKCWEEVLGGRNESTCFNPIGIIQEKRLVIGKVCRMCMNLLHRCYSCEFHFKQSVSRRLKDPHVQ